MAPARPMKRSSIRAKSNLLLSNPLHGATQATSFPPVASTTNKKSKRLKRRSDLLNRIGKSQKKDVFKKRRRPGKKLVTNLSNLLDVLPCCDESADRNDEKMKNRPTQKSLNSRPGVTRRKAKLERIEKKTFDQNLAQLIGLGKVAPSTSEKFLSVAKTGDNLDQNIASRDIPSQGIVTASKFAAIRAWANTNIEKHPSFKQIYPDLKQM